MTRNQLRFKKVETAEELVTLKAFAASFDHVVDEFSREPIVMVMRDQKLIAYFHVVNTPIFAHSFHTDPEILSARDFYDIIEQTRAYQFLTSLSGRTPHGESLILVPDETHFTGGILQKLGYTDLKQKLWHSLG